MNVVEKLIRLQKKVLLKQKIKLIKFKKKVDILRFNVSIANKFKFLIITIKKFSSGFGFYITTIIRIFVVETLIIVDDMLMKKRTIKSKNMEFHQDKIVKKYLNYVQNVSTTF